MLHILDHLQNCHIWGGGGGGGGVGGIYRWTGNEGFQHGISGFGRKHGRETVFSTLDGAGNYWKK